MDNVVCVALKRNNAGDGLSGRNRVEHKKKCKNKIYKYSGFKNSSAHLPWKFSIHLKTYFKF